MAVILILILVSVTVTLHPTTARPSPAVNSDFAIPRRNDQIFLVSSDRPTSKIPSDQADNYSESNTRHFEPPEAHEGNVARALFYVYAVYHNRGINLRWFRPQMKTLQTWHELDPVDQNELKRDAAIARFQGNHNPFVLYPDLVKNLER